MRITPLAISLATCLWLQSCTTPTETKTPSTASPQSKLTLSGANTIGSIVSELAKPYEAAHPGVKIDVQPSLTWRGIADTQQGTADIGMVTRSLKADEQKNLVAFTIAKDGLTMILHRDNPVKSLSNKQIVDIYNDKINNWKQVGGQDAPIVVNSRGEDSAALEYFVEHFQLERTAIRADVIVSNTKEAVGVVAGNPNAIGYASVGSAEFIAASGTSIKLLPINGVAASVANISNGTFPITRPLNLITQNPPSALEKEFIDFVLSKEGQDAVKENNFVPVSP